jgi:hypothetical protein
MTDKEFPSPCGEKVVSDNLSQDDVLLTLSEKFPSPCGEKVVSDAKYGYMNR